MKLNPITVIEIIDRDVTQVVSFTRDANGKSEEADEFFKQLLRENYSENLTEEEFQVAINAGSYKDGWGYECWYWDKNE